MTFRPSPIFLVLFLLLGFSASAQKISFVDTEYILEQMPEYRSAQKQLDDAAEGWRAEMQKRKEELDKLKRAYEAELVLLPEDIRKKREDEILLRGKEFEDFRKEKFGPDGMLFKKRAELIKPIQDRVFEAVQKVAKENALDFIFDKAGAVTMLFSNAKYDRSDEVLDELGIGAGKEGTEPKKDAKGNPIPDKIKGLLKDEKDDKKDPKNNQNPNNQGTPPPGIINPQGPR